MKRLILLLTCIFYYTYLSAHFYNLEDKKERLKINLIDFSQRHLLTIKGSYEFKLRDNRFLEPELGYTFYSFEDGIQVKGLLIGFSYNRYKFEEGRKPFFIKFNPYYQKIYLQNYLKYDTFLPDFGEYADYRMTRFTKNRYGLNFQIGRQYPLNEHLFFEFSTGLGLEVYNTITPKNVTQKYFRNGNDNSKMGIRPTLLIGVKLGWAL